MKFFFKTHTYYDSLGNLLVTLDEHLLDYFLGQLYPHLLQHVLVLLEQRIDQFKIRGALILVPVPSLLVFEHPRIENQGGELAQLEYHLSQERLVLLKPLGLLLGTFALLDRFPCFIISFSTTFFNPANYAYNIQPVLLSHITRKVTLKLERFCDMQIYFSVQLFF